jgi:hypothetical protein
LFGDLFENRVKGLAKDPSQEEQVDYPVVFWILSGDIRTQAEKAERTGNAEAMEYVGSWIAKNEWKGERSCMCIIFVENVCIIFCRVPDSWPW